MTYINYKHKKSLSQNFLVDENIKNKIVKSINIKKTDILLEIGAGNGSLSEKISLLSKKTYLIEIDTDLIPELLSKLNNSDNTNIHNDDILKFNMKDLSKKYKKLRIIGNLPYKISTKLLLNLINFNKKIKDIHIVIQKDMAERISTEPHTKDYNRLSIIAQYHFNIEKLFDIKPNSFKPIPKIISSFIKLTPKKNKKFLSNYYVFQNIIKDAFNNRRKKLSKSIKNINKLEKYININKRAENTNITEYIRISNFFTCLKND